MYSRSPLWFLAAVGGLTLAAGIVLALPPQRGALERALSFQHLVGGLGFGPALDLSGCASQFDPRICPECVNELGPLVNGRVFCPHHAFSILSYPRFVPTESQESEIKPHVPPY